MKRDFEPTKLYQYTYFSVDDDYKRQDCVVKTSPLFTNKNTMIDYMFDNISDLRDLPDLYLRTEKAYNTISEKYKKDLFIVMHDGEFIHFDSWKELMDFKYGNEYTQFNIEKYKYDLDAWVEFDKAASPGNYVERRWRLQFNVFELDPHNIPEKVVASETLGDDIVHIV